MSISLFPLQRVVQNDNGVHFYTTHSAKGNEFEYVFVVGCTKNFWEGKRGGGNEYRMPDTITATDEDSEKTYKVEVARRLFYVALTRAKKYLQVSYAQAENSGKPLETSVFIEEISKPEDRVSGKADRRAAYRTHLLGPAACARGAHKNGQCQLDRTCAAAVHYELYRALQVPALPACVLLRNHTESTLPEKRCAGLW